jgi:hypothetical protein
MGSTLYVSESHTTFLHEFGTEKTECINRVKSGTIIKMVCPYTRCNTS